MKHLLAISLLVLTSSCSYDQALTPEQQAQISAIDKQIEADKAEAKKIEADASLLLDKAQKENDPQALQDLAAIRVKYEEVKTSLAANEAKRNTALNEATNDNFGGVISFITGLIPGIPKPVSEGLLALGIPLLFKRPREHAVNAIKSLAMGRLDEVVKSGGKMYGLAHTNESPEQLIAAARTVALKEGDLAMVAKLDAMK